MFIDFDRVSELSMCYVLVNSICKEYTFSTTLSRVDIPPPAAGWKCDTLLFPKVQKEVIKKYQSSKRQGMIGQFREAQIRMFR